MDRMLSHATLSVLAGAAARARPAFPSDEGAGGASPPPTVTATSRRLPGRPPAEAVEVGMPRDVGVAPDDFHPVGFGDRRAMATHPAMPVAPGAPVRHAGGRRDGIAGAGSPAAGIAFDRRGSITGRVRGRGPALGGAIAT